MSSIELNATAKDLLSIRSMIAELEAEAEALTDKIKQAMTERGEETLTGDGWKASWKNIKQRCGLRQCRGNRGRWTGDFSRIIRCMRTGNGRSCTAFS